MCNIYAILHHVQGNARRLLFETYCRTHERVSMKVLATTLCVSEDEVEGLITPFIREAGVSARVHIRIISSY